MSKKYLRKYFIVLLAGFSVIAFCLRLGVCYELAKKDVQVLRPSAATDMATYKKYSENILAGTYQGEFYYQPFYYSAFLPAVKLVFGKDSIWALLIVQSLLGALTVYFCGLSAAMLWGRSSGLVAAFLVVFSKILMFYTPYYLIATLQAFWVSLILFMTIKVFKSSRLHNWGILGFIVSLAILTRGNIWFFVLGIMLLATLKTYRQLNKAGKKYKKSIQFLKSSFPALLFLSFVIIPQIPFAIKNSIVNGELKGPSTAAGAVLALGNTPEAPPGGREPGTGPGPMEYPESYHAWLSQKDSISVGKRIFDWFCAEPTAFLELQCRKLLLYWDSSEIPNNIALEYQGEKSFFLRITGFVLTSVLLFFSLAYIFYTWTRYFYKRKKRVFFIHSYGNILLIYFIVAYWLATAAFYILARFRAPSIPLFAIASSGMFLTVLRDYRKNGRKYIIRNFLPVFCVSFILVFFLYDAYRYNFESSIMKIVRPSGVVSELIPGQRVIYLDNGPVTFGSWRSIEFKKGDTLQKTFAVADISKNSECELIVPMFFGNAGSASFLVNGKEHIISAQKGFAEKKIKLENFNKKITLSLLKSNMNIVMFADFQRDYGRTKHKLRTEGVWKKMNAELVCKLIVNIKKMEISP
ncbi:MAG: glycosyltransferase family 39 protein [Verrucomicrobiota bacterium]|nr:glycosyltransferase family 39 protein [Verrucomicrobiota bacterium]